ncbi:MAG: hypothetical protein GKC10_08565 [Methanosarcinales archaeon]|nr:hypothetical protein [Methanosarcinales archaeon]
MLAALVVGSCYAHPNEAKGTVKSISRGDTFVVDGVGQVRLADVVAPDVTSMDGVHSKQYALEQLLNVQVFLDMDNVTGYNPEGTTVCVVYLANPNGTPNLNRIYNRMIVDAGFARLADDGGNEFDPADWYPGENVTA